MSTTELVERVRAYLKGPRHPHTSLRALGAQCGVPLTVLRAIRDGRSPKAVTLAKLELLLPNGERRGA